MALTCQISRVRIRVIENRSVGSESFRSLHDNSLIGKRVESQALVVDEKQTSLIFPICLFNIPGLYEKLRFITSSSSLSSELKLQTTYILQDETCRFVIN